MSCRFKAQQTLLNAVARILRHPLSTRPIELVKTLSTSLRSGRFGKASPISTHREIGGMLHRNSIVSVPDHFFPTPTQKKKVGLAARDYTLMCLRLRSSYLNYSNRTFTRNTLFLLWKISDISTYRCIMHSMKCISLYTRLNSSTCAWTSPLKKTIIFVHL